MSPLPLIAAVGRLGPEVFVVSVENRTKHDVAVSHSLHLGLGDSETDVVMLPGSLVLKPGQAQFAVQEANDDSLAKLCEQVGHRSVWSWTPHEELIDNSDTQVLNIREGFWVELRGEDGVVVDRSSVDNYWNTSKICLRDEKLLSAINEINRDKQSWSCYRMREDLKLIDPPWKGKTGHSDLIELLKMLCQSP